MERAAMNDSTSTPEERLLIAGYCLPPPPQPRGAYAPHHVVPLPGGGKLLTISGQTCRVNGMAITGLCAADAVLETARKAATIAMLNVLAAVATACEGSLPAYLHVCRLRGFVRSSPEFQAHAAVLDAASHLLCIAWPDAPKPARTAVGVTSLPDSALIEIELDALLV